VDKAREIGDQAPATQIPTPAAGPVPPAAPVTPITQAPVVPEPDDLTGNWLRNLETSETEDFISKPGSLETPDWLSELKDEPKSAGFTPEKPQEKSSILDDLETPDWLSDLGPKPVSQSSIEDVPDWLHASSGAPSGGPAKQETGAPFATSFESNSGAVDLPDWLAGLDKEEAAAPLAETSSDEVPAWLKSEIEPEPQVTEKAHPADWKPIEIKQPFEEPQIPQSAAVIDTPAPPVPPEKPVQKVEQRVSEPLPPVPARVEIPTQKVEQRISEPAWPAPAPVEIPVQQVEQRIEQPRPAPAKVAAAKPASAPSRTVQAAAPSTLGNAQTELGRGNIAASLDIYGKLIRKGKSLEEIIRDLRDALYRYPVEVPIWQALGDAYMRANRLQEALDAYTKAEELLR
jgi:hypothetical protein